MLKDLIADSWYESMNNEEKTCFEEKYKIVQEKRATQEILPYESDNSGIYYALKILMMKILFNIG